MDTKLSSAGRPAFYTIREVAWILGVSEGRVHRAIRLGRLRPVRQRSRLVVPAGQVASLLGGTVDGDCPSGRRRSERGDTP
jgi:hypothetical protein